MDFLFHVETEITYDLTVIQLILRIFQLLKKGLTFK